MKTPRAHRAVNRAGTTALILAIAFVGLVPVEILFAPHYRPVFPWHHLPGYMGLIGLCACVGMVLLAKGAAALFLQRPENDDDRD